MDASYIYRARLRFIQCRPKPNYSSSCPNSIPIDPYLTRDDPIPNFGYNMRVQESLILYQYQGFWYPRVFVQGIVNCQKQYEAGENDIFLVTAPKSGTTWFSSILYALMNREAHPPQDTHHPLLNKAPGDLVPLIELLDPSKYDLVCNSSGSSTRIFASHIPLASLPKSITDNATSSNCKVVYVCRDIKDIFVSLFHFLNKGKYLRSPISFEHTFDLYCKGYLGPGPVWDQILGYWKESLENPQKVLFMKYEDMKN
ncbi:cytosolic sulfotransferase 13-like [Apium graveolens]|uniref:cytosolic sulfotransferase 13-like n=1 Tax=Apium graveolens TaxID=4045 RepID=UPI003D7A284B